MRLGLTPELALTKHVAVRLIVVRRGAGTEEVRFKVAAQLEFASVAFHKSAQAALPAREVQLADVTFIRTGEWDGVERRVDVRIDGVLTPDTFKGEEGNRRDRHALVVDRGGRLNLVLNACLVRD